MIRRAFAVWLLIVVAEVIHGILRTLFLVPLAGDFRARQIGVFTGSLLILAIATATIRWLGLPTLARQFQVGVLWLVWMVLFELAFGRWVADLSWDRLLADYNILAGGLLPFGLLLLLLSPFLAARLRGLSRYHQ